MPKSTPAEMMLLHAEVFARDGGCVWPGCDYTGTVELAHLTHRGMGGSRERNTPENAVILCSIHHDCLDGRTGLGILRKELNAMLRAVVGVGSGTQ